MKNTKISILIIVTGIIITCSLFVFNQKNTENTESYLKRFEDWKEVKIEDVAFLIPEEAKVVDQNNFYAKSFAPDKTPTLVLTKTVSKGVGFDNIEDWYKRNQERSFFWVRYYKFYNERSGKVTPALVVRTIMFDENADNFQEIKFFDEEGYFYNVTIRNFANEDLEYFLENIVLDKI